MGFADTSECIVYTWDYHSSLSVWNGLRTQPILTDEVQTFKALILVHKLLQEGHPVVSAAVLRPESRHATKVGDMTQLRLARMRRAPLSQLVVLMDLSLTLRPSRRRMARSAGSRHVVAQSAARASRATAP